MKKFSQFSAYLVWGLSCIFSRSAIPAENQFRVNGLYTTENHVSHDAVISRGHEILFVPRVSGKFDVQVKGCRWIIRTTKDGEDGWYSELGFDGKDIYFYDCMYERLEARRSKGLATGKNNGEAMLMRGPYPYAPVEILRVVWLAYCSNCYFESLKDDKVFPLSTFSSSNRELEYLGLKQKGNWELAKQTGLPEHVYYFHDGVLRSWKDESLGYLAGPPAERNWDRPYDHGFTNAIFRVKEHFPKVQNSLPSHAQFEMYAPLVNGTHAEDLKTLRTVNLVATNFASRVAVDTFVPKVRGVTVTGDLRFAGPANPGFMVSYDFDTEWLSEEAVKSSPKFQEAIKYYRDLIKIAKSRPE